MVVRILRLTEPPKPADAADALALAICHIWRGDGAEPAGRGDRQAARDFVHRERGGRAGETAQESQEWRVIAFCRGQVASVEPDGAVVEVGGVGHARALRARHAGRS